VSSHCALSSLDVIRLVLPTATAADRAAGCGEVGQLAGHLSEQLATLAAAHVAIVDGLVVPIGRFVAHCQAAAIPAVLPLDQDLSSLAQQCQAAIQQTACVDWLPQLQQTWERSDLNYPLVVLRPSLGGAMPIAANDLLLPRIGAIDELEAMLKALWAEVFCARNLRYWVQSGVDLSQIPLATVIQPLRTIDQSGRLWVTAATVIVERFWGVQWLGHPQEMEVPLTVIDRATGQARSSPANPQQLVHGILGHWPRALPLSTPLIVAGDQWLLPHPLASETGRSPSSPLLPASPVTDALAIALASSLEQELVLPLRVDWQYSHGQLQVQSVYLNELAPLASRLAAVPLSGPVDAGLLGGADPAPDAVIVATGLAATTGARIGRAVVVQADQSLLMALSAESILVTTQLTPDWLPLMRQAAGMITEEGGMTSHGAVMARSLGMSAIVGVDQATQKIRTGDWLKLEAGQIHRLSPEAAIAGMIAYPAAIAPPVPKVTKRDRRIPKASTQPSSTQLLWAISQPSQVTAPEFDPWDGIGLLRGEHLLAAALGDCSPWRPIAVADRDRLSQTLHQSLGTVLQAVDGPVWYRLADWRSHEMPHGTVVPSGANPALGMHGTWYYKHFPEWLDLELAAIAQLDGAARSALRVVLPFVRTADEVSYCAEALRQGGLADVPLWIMAEVPAIMYALPDCAAAGIRGITIGLNDLLQLLFGADREQALMADFFDPSHPAVRSAVRSVLTQLITTAQQLGLDCTVCSVPADVGLIEFLVELGVTGIVVDAGNLDVVARVMARETIGPTPG
jgi:pyruvate, water dikinase